MPDKNDYEIIGENLQAVRIKLLEGKSVVSDPGNLVYMTDNIKMNVTLGNQNLSGKFLGGIKRTIVGENFFLTNFKSSSEAGEVVFSSPVPGKIMPLEIQDGSIICEKQAYLCSDSDISINITFVKRIGVGLFGREGFILQKLTGKGTVFIQASGSIIKKSLTVGESIKVDPGCVVAFDPSVNYDIKYVGDFKTALFGGIGLFFVTLSGPGNVFIQTLPLNKLSQKIMSANKYSKARSKG
jgi:uncharacterized protein (TIGR00266 family)